MEEKTKDDLNEKFDKLTDTKQSESKDMFCDRFCNRGYDCHRCTEESNKESIGCDIRNVTDVFDTDDEEADPMTYNPCAKYDKTFDSYNKVRNHFSSNHTPDKDLKCSLFECEFSTKNIDVMIMHIGVNHLEFVWRKL